MVIHVGHDFADRVLMSPATYFKVTDPDKDEHGPANDFAIEGWKVYSADPDGFNRRAIEKTELLRDFYRSVGIGVVELPATPELHDLIYTADPSLSLRIPKGSVTTGDASGILREQPWQTVTLISRFTNPERLGEAEYTATFLKAEFPERVFIQHAFHTEGTGDNVYDAYRDVFWSGYSNRLADGAMHGRSDIRSHATLQHVTGVPVVSLEVMRPYFHDDTTLFPLSKGHILVYPGGLAPEAFEKFKQRAFYDYGLDPEKYMKIVSQEDALRLACNGQVIIDERTGTHTVATAECSAELQQWIRNAGYETVISDMTETIHAGGSKHCISQNLDETRVPGGWHSFPKHLRYKRSSLGIQPQA